jgi:non-homologous end joining protein Ku
MDQMLERVGTVALADESPVLAALTIAAIEAVQQRQKYDPNLKDAAALDDCMARLGKGVDALNKVHEGAIDPAHLGDDYAKKVSAIIESVKAAHDAAGAFLHDVQR